MTAAMGVGSSSAMRATVRVTASLRPTAPSSRATAPSITRRRRAGAERIGGLARGQVRDLLGRQRTRELLAHLLHAQRLRHEPLEAPAGGALRFVGASAGQRVRADAGDGLQELALLVVEGRLDGERDREDA